MGLLLIRVLLFLLSGAAGYMFALDVTGGEDVVSWILALAVGVITVLITYVLEMLAGKLPTRTIIGGIIGLIVGFTVGESIYRLIMNSLAPEAGYARVLLNAFFGYLGLAYGAMRGRQFNIAQVKNMFSAQQREGEIKIFDTSVIIDGRIADICKTGFLDGLIYIPRFVLKELQHIADSPELLKRNRGRRGLDILNMIQKNLDVKVEIVETDFSHVKEVDAKLVELAKRTGGKLVTNDFNLNKIAELQSIPVLNVNELANAVKPVVLPGELMKVRVLKEGKEPGQGVAYLDDGTMVVVDNASRVIGRDIEVAVTSVLQTTAGRMIFGKPKEEAAQGL